MKCPTCSFISSNKKDVCNKCGLDLRPYKKKLGISIVDPNASVEELKKASTGKGTSKTETKAKTEEQQEGRVAAKDEANRGGSSWLKKIWEKKSSKDEISLEGVDDIFGDEFNEAQLVADVNRVESSDEVEPIELNDPEFIKEEEIAPTTASPQIMEFGDDEDALEEQLDRMIGDMTMDVEAVRADESHDSHDEIIVDTIIDDEDDIDVEIEFDVEDELEQKEDTDRKHLAVQALAEAQFATAGETLNTVPELLEALERSQAVIAELSKLVAKAYGVQAGVIREEAEVEEEVVVEVVVEDEDQDEDQDKETDQDQEQEQEEKEDKEEDKEEEEEESGEVGLENQLRYLAPQIELENIWWSEADAEMTLLASQITQELELTSGDLMTFRPQPQVEVLFDVVEEEFAGRVKTFTDELPRSLERQVDNSELTQEFIQVARKAKKVARSKANRIDPALEALETELEITNLNAAKPSLRLLAKLIDAGLAVSIGFMFAATSYIPFDVTKMLLTFGLPSATKIALYLPVFINCSVAVWLVMNVFFVLTQGSTIGKKMLGLSVVANHGSTLHPSQVFVRAACEFFTPLTFGLSALPSVFKKATLHDYCAQTAVVQE